MDKDMMDKVNEAMKANDMRKLSLDELDKVSGGAGSIRSVDGIWYDEAFVLDLGRNMTQQFGYQVAAQILCEKFGYSKTEISTARRCADDMASIDVLVNTMFKMADKLENGGSSY